MSKKINKNNRKIMFRPLDIMKFDKEERYSKLKIWYSSIKFSWKEVFSYYSSWAIVCFFIPFQTRIFKLMKLHMILHAALGGAYISYIHPKILYVHYMNIILDGLLLQIVDFFAHQVFLLSFHNNIPKVCNLVDLCFVNTPILIYICNFDIGYRYGLGCSDIILLLLVYVFLNLCFLL